MTLLKNLKQKFCYHMLYTKDMQLNETAGHYNRITWPCHKCGKVFSAHCGLDITPKHGYIEAYK